MTRQRTGNHGSASDAERGASEGDARAGRARRASLHTPPALCHTAIRASAGSGKTFQLTNRYLQLVVEGARPQTILASTFTRLAAGQIRDRILARLAGAAEDDSKRHDLARHLSLPSLSREQVLRILADLSRQMHLMQIRTLDSFFAAIVRAFAIELQMPLGAQVVDEEQAAALRSQAISLMLDEHDPQQLIELLRLLTQGASDRAITSTIDSVVSDLYELWCEAPPEAWECVPALPGRLSPPQLVAAIQNLEAVACPPGKSLGKAFISDCENARAWRWAEFLKSGIAGALARGQDAYSRQTIPPDLRQAYEPVVKHAIADLIGRVHEQTIATRDLLQSFHQRYEAVKRRQRAVTFDDLTRCMIRSQQLGTLDEIAFRLDARLHHLLLDEFQDTSISQWHALEPLVRDVTSVAPPERSFFCVGDVKQSIYGWRDAAPEVLDDLPDILRGIDGQSPITLQHLSRSYRSSPIIMDAVNGVFEQIQQNPSLTEFAEAAAAFARGFQRHETQRNELPGYAEIRFCKAAAEHSDEKADLLRLRAAAELACEIHRANPGLSIAILTRTNRAVARLMYELGPSQLDIPGGVSGRGGGPLCDAAPVNVILDLLHLADHPDDTVAAFNVAMAPVEIERWKDAETQRRRGEETWTERDEETGRQSEEERSWWCDARVRRAMARQVRRSLLDEGYAATIRRWVLTIAPACDGRELRRLRELINLADTFDQHRSLRSGEFIRLVEETRIADIQPAAVQVMTVHQAKGLEFDAVILAELTAPLTGLGNPPVLVERGHGQSATGPVTRVCRSINKDLLPFVPQLQPLVDRHCLRVVRESLSVLYVAMTRAIHGLYMIANPPSITKGGDVSKRFTNSLAGVICNALAPGATEAQTIIYEHGDAKWMGKVSMPRVPVEIPAPVQRITLAPSRDYDLLLRGVRVDAASTLTAGGELAWRLRLPDLESRHRGVAIHALFEQVHWLEDFSLDDDALARMVRDKIPRRDARWACAIVHDFRSMLQRESIRRALSRSACAMPRCDLYRELPFAHALDGGVQSGYIDRAVIELDAGGRPCAARILDFKTDRIEPGRASEMAVHYRSQMHSYRQAVSRMFQIDPARITTSLLLLEIGEVIAVDVGTDAGAPLIPSSSSPCTPSS